MPATYCGETGGCEHHPEAPSSSVAVSLPRRFRPEPTPTVWNVDNVLPPSRERQLEEILEGAQPLTTKCAVNDRAGAQCCKDLKGDDERHLISPEIVRDM